MSVSKVFFSRNVSPETVVMLYDRLGRELNGNVAVKVHSGEDGNQNFLRPEFWKPVFDRVCGTIVECNTAYEGERNSTPKHIRLIKKHGWSDVFPVDLMDAEGPDIEIPVPESAKHLKSDIMGKHFTDYDSMLVLAHFKGHPMGGFGGALKQLSIGCASAAGKVNIHSAGKYRTAKEQDVVWTDHAPQNDFLESMAEAAAVGSGAMMMAMEVATDSAEAVGAADSVAVALEASAVAEVANSRHIIPTQNALTENCEKSIILSLFVIIC